MTVEDSCRRSVTFVYVKDDRLWLPTFRSKRVDDDEDLRAVPEKHTMLHYV